MASLAAGRPMVPSKFRIQEFVLPLGLVGSLVVIIAPLPAAVIDVLLTINIAVAVLVLLTTVFVKTPLEFSVFPTVLLAATLGRLVLNIATTRLILTHAHQQGLAAAGGIVAGFGRFVAGDQVLVGIILFTIIVLIQFLVVTKGATRISEVSARFALDGMPGQQMAIDADLNSGVITQQEAQQRRADLQSGASFYGAMDGASKFVRGDAIAGLCITLINVVGGLFLGVFQGHMSLVEASELYTRLTIGDGLVSQIPAFLIALAAGILITRSSERINLPVEFLRQLLSRPEPLMVAATFLGVLVFANLPAIPLLLVGGTFAGIAYWLTSNDDEAESQQATEALASESTTIPEQRVEDLLTVNPVELEIGVGLVRLADLRRGGDLLQRITELRKSVASSLGIVMPRVRICDNLQLDEYEYRLKIFENPVTQGQSFPLRIFAMDRGGAQGSLEGVPAEYSPSGARGVWIDPANQDAAVRQGFQLNSAADVVVAHLKATIEQHADELLTREATQCLIEQHRQFASAIIDELLDGKLDLRDIQQVLRYLLREHVPIRNMAGILEAMSDGLSQHQDLDELSEFVRQRMARSLCASLANSAGELTVVTLSADWTSRLSDIVESHSTEELLVNPILKDELTDDIIAALAAHRADHPPVLVVSAKLRVLVRQAIGRDLPHVRVLSLEEVQSTSNIRSAGIVGELGAAA